MVNIVIENEDEYIKNMIIMDLTTMSIIVILGYIIVSGVVAPIFVAPLYLSLFVIDRVVGECVKEVKSWRKCTRTIAVSSLLSICAYFLLLTFYAIIVP